MIDPYFYAEISTIKIKKAFKNVILTVYSHHGIGTSYLQFTFPLFDWISPHDHHP